MIRFVDLGAQHRALLPDLADAARRVIESGQFVLGPEVTGFEAEFAAWCGCSDAVALNSGTSALHLALLAAGVGPGDEVITVPMTFVATVAAILYTGATVRLIDVDPLTWVMDPDQLEAAITPRTKAVVPVHLHGRLADMDALLRIARARGLVVIEDAAQAHGAERNGRRAGSFGDIGCFSFYPAKNLGACGEGGAIVTNRPDLAARVRRLKDWGQAEKYLHVEQGFNYRMDALQAAFLRIKLPYMDTWNRTRRQTAVRYNEQLRGVGIMKPGASQGLDHVYHIYAVRLARRDQVRDLLAATVQTAIHYPIAVHLQPAYATIGYRAGDFPISEALSAELLSLPMHPDMTESDVDTVCAELCRAQDRARMPHAAA